MNIPTRSEEEALPANLTPQYREAEERWRRADTLEEKLAALQDMLRIIPKHKGTDKMQADLKRRIAKTRDAIESQRRSGARSRPVYMVERQGAGQICLAGPPNAGKSQILHYLTNAEPEVADYPFTTTLPQPGMMQYENAAVQLLDLPPLYPDMSPSWLPGVLQASDGLVLVLSLASDDVLVEAEAVFSFLEQKSLRPVPGLSGESDNKLEENWSTADGDAGEGARRRRWPTLIAATKCDVADSHLRRQLLEEHLAAMLTVPLPLMEVSAVSGHNMEQLREAIWRMLGKIRVYTRTPGKEPDYTAPFIIDRGSTVLDAATAVHKEIAASLKYARVWGKNTFDAQMVGRDHVLTDGDVIQLHT